MPENFIYTIVVTGFTVAFFHAALPTHWLPFVLASRAQSWTQSRTLSITTLASAGHALFTTLLGALIVWFGIELSESTNELFHWIAGGVLLLVGGYYIVRQVLGKGHGHYHLLGEHGHELHDHDYEQSEIDKEIRLQKKSDRVTIGGLLMLLTFSPCESFLPVYLSGSKYGWTGFALLSIVLFVATISGMVLFTWLARLGFEKLKLKLLEEYENGILGVLLCVLGVIVLLLEH